MGQNYISADKYLQDISRDKRYWENKRQEIHHKEKKLESTIQRYEDEFDRIHAQKHEIIAKAKAEAQQLLDSSNAKIERTIRDIKEAQAERERTKQVREKLTRFKEHVDTFHAAGPSKSSIKEGGERTAKGDRKGSSALHPSSTIPKPVTLAEGSYVKMKGQTTIGRVLKLNGREALVAFGAIQTNVKLNRLEPSEAPKAENRTVNIVRSTTQDQIRETTLRFTGEIDVRGLRGDECLQTIGLFIDDALVANASRVRILHGTGNGILRQLIRQYLNTIPDVTSYRDENPQFGGTGITVVDLQ